MKTLSVVVALFFLTGCSTSPEKKSDHYKNILVGFVAGSIVGSINVPKNEEPAAHMALWGSATAILSGVYSISQTNHDEEMDKLKRSNILLREAMSKGENQGRDIISAGSNMFLEKPLPDDFKDHVIPGRWEVYKAVIPDGNGSLVKGRQIRIIPPKIKSIY